MKQFYAAVAVDPKTTDAAHVNRVTVDDNGEKRAVFLKEFPTLAEAQSAADQMNANPPALTEQGLADLDVPEPGLKQRKD